MVKQYILAFIFTFLVSLMAVSGLVYAQTPSPTPDVDITQDQQDQQVPGGAPEAGRGGA